MEDEFMKKNLKRALCLALCMTTVAFATSCELLLEELPPFSYSSGFFDGDNSIKENGSSDKSEITPTPDPEPMPEPEEPDPEKELLKTETDSLGHKIAYYSDGTWEDLGRVVALDFTPQAPTERYGYQALAVEEKVDGLRGFYLDLYDAAMDFSASKADVTADGNYYTVAKIDFSKHGLSDQESLAAYKTFAQDYPEFYWTAGNFGISPKELTFCVESDYAKYSDRAAVQDVIETAALKCDTYLNGLMSETERAVVIHDYLATEITYAYESDGAPSDEVWAHNIVGWAERNAGVCETYAEAFTYLCNLFGLECTTVVGVAATSGTMGAHAWNILKLEEEWYAVDVTWDDGFESTYSHIIDRSWFGKAASEFTLSHVADSPANGLNITYQFAMPTLSENTLSPVLLSENQGESVLVGSVDKAFEKMTNEEGVYEITLYPATQVLAEKNMYVYCMSATVSADFPKVKALYLRGTSVVIDSTVGSIFKPILTSSQTLDLGCDVVLEMFDFETVGLNVGAYSLTLNEGARINAEQTVTGDVGSTLLVNGGESGGYGISITAIELDSIKILSDSLSLLGGGKVNSLLLYSDTTLNLSSGKNFAVLDIYNYGKGRIYVENTLATTELSFGNVHAAQDNPSAESSFMIRLGFDGAENYPILKLTGESDLTVDIAVEGTVTASSYWRYAQTSDIDAPIVNLGTKLALSDVEIYFVESGYYVPKTHLYTVKTNGDVCLK